MFVRTVSTAVIIFPALNPQLTSSADRDMTVWALQLQASTCREASIVQLLLQLCAVVYTWIHTTGLLLQSPSLKFVTQNMASYKVSTNVYALSSCNISYSCSVSLVLPPEVSCRRHVILHKNNCLNKNAYFFNLLPYEIWERTKSGADAISILEVRTTATLESATAGNCKLWSTDSFNWYVYRRFHIVLKTCYGKKLP
jgi:hypothetical protein